MIISGQSSKITVHVKTLDNSDQNPHRVKISYEYLINLLQQSSGSKLWNYHVHLKTIN